MIHLCNKVLKCSSLYVLYLHITSINPKKIKLIIKFPFPVDVDEYGNTHTIQSYLVLKYCKIQRSRTTACKIFTYSFKCFVIWNIRYTQNY